MWRLGCGVTDSLGEGLYQLSGTPREFAPTNSNPQERYPHSNPGSGFSDANRSPPMISLEKDECIITNKKIPVAFLAIKFDRKSAIIS